MPNVSSHAASATNAEGAVSFAIRAIASLRPAPHVRYVTSRWMSTLAGVFNPTRSTSRRVVANDMYPAS